MKLIKKEVEEGKFAEIVPLTYGRARIILTDGHQVFNGW